MKKTLFLPALMMLSVAVSAAPVSFPEHNFSIETPAGWTAINDIPKPMLAAYQNADGSKKMLLLVQKLAGAQRALTNSQFLDGMKKGMARQGMVLDSEQPGTIQGLPSITVTGHLPTGITLTAHVVGAGDKMYVMQAVLAPGIAAATDSEVQSVVQSFKFLTPVPALAESSDSDAVAFRVGFIIGVVLVLTIVVVGVVFIIKRVAFSKPKA